jgi:predicted cation transporter
MIIGLLIVLALILVLPFVIKPIEHNLEYFLLVMGVSATAISGTLSPGLIVHILENRLLYFITGAVLIAGFIFRISVNKIKAAVSYATNKIPLSIFIFLVIVVLGLISSLITAIIAALLLVEIVHALPLKHAQKLQLTVIACFSIGLGAALTPIGEPLSTIVISTLKGDFMYLFRNIGIYIIPGILALGLLGAVRIGRRYKTENTAIEGEDSWKSENEGIVEIERLGSVFVRAIKIFLFIIALELLGSGFKPLINTYVIHLDSMLLYWINMSSAVLDNATLAAAEVSPAMSLKQIKAILMGLLLSGGMLIPGNIPNIISAGKLGIKSREWAKAGLPLGLFLLLIYFLLIFFI